MQTKITAVTGREILDSRGNPTVEAEVRLACGAVGRAAAPSGASTGAHEAVELRDGEGSRYDGKGVLQAVRHVNTVLQQAVLGIDAQNSPEIDRRLCELDGTGNKSRMGANAVLAVSLAAAQAAAAALEMPLFRLIGGSCAHTLPVPMMNILNGGAHAANDLDVQEFMILPVGAPTFAEGVRQCSEVYHTLRGLLYQAGLSTAVGDEGGFAPALPDTRSALEYILRAIRRAGYTPGKDFLLALDAAASEWQTETPGKYHLPKCGEQYTAAQLCAYWQQLCREYPICSLEDPLGEEDWPGWQQLTASMGGRVRLIGDDLFVTNVERLLQGIKNGSGSGLLVKPNQIGTLLQTVQAVELAKSTGFLTILSHRSGETEDTAIADLAVGLGTPCIKTGAPCRGERTAKYNRLLRIEEVLGESAVYAGRTTFCAGAFTQA